MSAKRGNGVPEGWRPDGTDDRILDCYRQDAECPKSHIARELEMSQTTVRERIERLKAAGVLEIVAVIDRDRVSSQIEAYVEVMFPGDVNVHEELCKLAIESGRKEIRDAITLIGDVDALIRVRAKDVAALRDLVSEIRGNPLVVGTRTRIVAGNWWHAKPTAGTAEARELKGSAASDVQAFTAAGASAGAAAAFAE